MNTKTRDMLIIGGLALLVAAVAFQIYHANESGAASTATIDGARQQPVGAAPPATVPPGTAKKDAQINVVAEKEGQHVVTADGLIVDIEKLGTGDSAVAGATVNVNYTGTLANGSVFDSSEKHGGPISFPIGIGMVIKGWDEGVVGMKVGEKRKLTIPPDIGYGPMGTPGGPIPPNATLTFEVELVGVKLPPPVVVAEKEGQHIKTDDGIQIDIETLGSGAQASAGNSVLVSYKGALENGTVFDASDLHGGPATFPIGVGRVIKGWDEGVVGMKVGEKRKLVIPPELAYGAKEIKKPDGSTAIPANATLTFEIELLGVH